MGVNGPVALAAELDDLVARVHRQDGDDVDPSEVWLLIARWATYRAAKANLPSADLTGTDP